MPVVRLDGADRRIESWQFALNILSDEELAPFEAQLDCVEVIQTGHRQRIVGN